MAATFSTGTSNAALTPYSSTRSRGQGSRSGRHQFFVALSQCLCDFIAQLIPKPEEMAMREEVRVLLETLIQKIEPKSRLLSFGSTANGFSLRNSDMDLCCLLDSEQRLSASDLVTAVGSMLERETKFIVKALPHARIPIVKLSLKTTPNIPYEIACDIGFENRLALENTRLLHCYASIDPARVQTLVLFLKVWTKRRKINDPYLGTLSSYGYVLLVIYFLVHVQNPPVLPNLQQVPPMRSMSDEEMYYNGHNIWFFDDVELLRQRWQSSNTQNVAELLADFFKYYSRDFLYTIGVASIRVGFQKKEDKGWLSDPSDPRARNRLCIEDPFEIDFNVGRCVTKEGLYTIRGEFMRASRILANRRENTVLTLAELCEDKKDSVPARPPPLQPFIPPQPSRFPPQPPYTVGSGSPRPTGDSASDKLAPAVQLFASGQATKASTSALPTQHVMTPAHMAPKRSLYTSPPPPDAPQEDRRAFEDRLGMGLSLALSSTEARRSDPTYLSSSSNSEVPSDDDGRSDDLFDDTHSVHSYQEEPLRRDAVFQETPVNFVRAHGHLQPRFTSTSHQADDRNRDNSTPRASEDRGRVSHRRSEDSEARPVITPTGSSHRIPLSHSLTRPQPPKRSNSGPSRPSFPRRFNLVNIPSMNLNISTSSHSSRPSSRRSSPTNSPSITSMPTVFYDTRYSTYGTTTPSSLQPSPLSPFPLYRLPHSSGLPPYSPSISPLHPSSVYNDPAVQLAGASILDPAVDEPKQFPTSNEEPVITDGRFDDASSPPARRHGHTLSTATVRAPVLRVQRSSSTGSVGSSSSPRSSRGSASPVPESPPSSRSGSASPPGREPSRAQEVTEAVETLDPAR